MRSFVGAFWPGCLRDLLEDLAEPLPEDFPELLTEVLPEDLLEGFFVALALVAPAVVLRLLFAVAFPVEVVPLFFFVVLDAAFPCPSPAGTPSPANA